ncbi:MAG: biliverdin-producing heme oxygenase [Agriterribacter sp.]
MYLTEKIKIQTRAAHQALEKLIVAKIKSIRSLKDYEQLLKMFYGFYQPVESKTDAYINPSVIPDYSLRRKSENILKDLSVLSGQPAEELLLATAEISFIKSEPAALGAMYVLEGSTLGGIIIADMLTRYAKAPAASLSFFKAYKEENQTMWLKFVERLNLYGASNDHTVVVNAAAHTFEQFKTWAEEFEISDLKFEI